MLVKRWGVWLVMGVDAVVGSSGSGGEKGVLMGQL